MAGTSNKTTVVSVRVPNDTLAEWQSVNTGSTMGAFILDRAIGSAAAEARAGELEEAAESWRMAHLKSERARVELQAALDGRTSDPTCMTIRVFPEVLELVPGDDKVAVVEAYVNERFGYGRHRLEDLLKPKGKSNK